MDSTLKYDLLGPFEKKEVQDFIDFLFSKKNDPKKEESPGDYKKKILSVSTWSENDIKVFEESKKQFNQWQPPVW